MRKEYEGVAIECVQGNITAQPDIAAIVNAANAQLLRGGGVAGAIHRAAGPGLEQECRPLAPIKTGEAVITGGHNLPNRYVIHCLGPVYGTDKPEAVLLGNCYRNALKLVSQKEIDSVAFPAISAGIFGYPLAEAAEVAIKTVMEEVAVSKPQNLKTVRFVLFGPRDLQVFEETMSRLMPDK
ncbi:MAG TPA: RNase III inhibitor [Firmicutes bacterium]|jgi:O-acetyl-ADP-ribose deacetylase (regulator of RNase III)|nr:RNase III inhibitor [Bacillota bacterium]